MAEDKSIKLSNNMDVHYLIKQETFDIRESVDLRHYLNTDNSFLSSLSGSSSKLVSLTDQVKKVELFDEDNIYILEDIPRYADDSPMTAKDFDTLMSRLQWSYLKSLVTIPYHESVYMFLSKWASQTSKILAKRIQEAERTLLLLLAEEDTSVGLLYGLFDSLDDTNNIDTVNSTVVLDTDTGIALPATLNNTEIKDTNIIQLLNANSIILSDYLDTNIVSPRHNTEKHRPFLASRKIYVKDPKEPVSLEINIKPNDIDFKKSSSFLIKLPAKNGIEKLKVVSKSKGADTFLVKEQEVKSETVFGSIENPIENLEELKFIFVSTVPDGTDDNGTYHLFLVSSLYLFDASLIEGISYLKTNELEFLKRDGEPYRFKRLYVEVNDNQESQNVLDSNKIRIKAEVFYPDKNKWSPAIPIQNSSSKLVVPSIGFSNISLRDDQLVVPFELGASQYFAQVEYKIEDATVPDMQFSGDTFTSILDPDEMIVVRGAGSKVPHINSDNSLFSDTETSGWLFVNGYYKTNIFIPEGDSIEINFGSKPVLINGIQVTGKFNFPSGIHSISILSDNWRHIDAGLTASQVKIKDPLFPYNHKYLIQGYRDVTEYPGITIFGRQVCTFVDPDYLMFNLHNEESTRLESITGTKYPSIYSLYSRETPSKETFILLPIDSTYTDFYKEKVVVWGQKYSHTELASKLKLTFELESSLTSIGSSEIPIYISSYAARVI